MQGLILAPSLHHPRMILAPSSGINGTNEPGVWAADIVVRTDGQLSSAAFAELNGATGAALVIA
jgi:hypothetical protein